MLVPMSDALHCPSRGRWCVGCAVRVSDVCQVELGPELCELLHIGSRITDPCLQQELCMDGSDKCPSIRSQLH